MRPFSFSAAHPDFPIFQSGKIPNIACLLQYVN